MSSVLPFPSNREPVEAAPDPTLKEAMGDVLREERIDQERTLADVASGAGVSLPYLSEVERGRKDASSEVIEAICDELDVAVPDVLERTADRLRVDARMQRTTRFQLLAA